MALQKSITTPQGVDLSTAYGKITGFGWNGDKLAVSFSWFTSSAARHANKQAIDLKRYSMALPAGGDMRTQIYDYLKTLPDFAGAIDC